MKTTIDVDRDAAERAAGALGTSTLKETVNASLREVADAACRQELSALVRSDELSVPTAAELARLRSPGIPPGALARLAERG